MRWLPLALVLACASAHPVMTPSGQRGWFIKCRSEEKCFAKAERVCPLGYRIIRERETRTAIASKYGDATIVRERPGASLLIECGHLDE